MSTPFEPVAIVGQACVLPQALSPEGLWEAVSEGRDLTSAAPSGIGRHVTARIAAPRGGFVTGFREVFDPRGFALPPEEVVALDPLFTWVLHTGREALRSAGIPSASGRRIGAVLGQMALPSAGARRFAASVWLGTRRGPISEAEARDRFTSGLPALLLAQALGLESGAFTVAAAGASSLYALKLACDRLHDRRADVMLAGAVSAADRTFCRDVLAALGVLSPSGRGRPLSREGDGLVPAEGAVFVALKRLGEALADGDRVLAVIRGLAVAGDGRVSSESKGSQDAYEKVMRRTYEVAATAPEEVSLVECDAAGVLAADGVEIRALARVFKDAGKDAGALPLGSVKSNLGHAFAASGLVGLLKVIGALRSGERPPTLHAEAPHLELVGTALRLLRAPEAWPGVGPRKAAVSAFGLGGHTAHLLVEEHVRHQAPAATPPRPGVPLQPEVAVVSVAATAASAWDADDLVRLLMSGESHLGEEGGRAESFLLSREDLRLAPRDLKSSLPQQLALLAVARQALAGVEPPPREATGIFAGIQADVEMARFSLRRQERRRAAPRLTDRAVAGTLPEVAVQRLAKQLDVAGPSFVVAAEELSGIVALELAVRALERGEIDVAVVGAVDLCCEPVHAAAAGALFGLDRNPPGDAACVLVLKRRAAARRARERILAVVERVETAPREPWVEPSPSDPDRSSLLVLGLGGERLGLTRQVGHAHAASGLLHVAAGILACHHRAFPGRGQARRGRGHEDARNLAAVPWLVSGRRRAEVRMEALGKGRGIVEVREERTGRAGPLLMEGEFPRLHLYSGADREAVARRVAAQSAPDPPGRPGGPARLVLVAESQEELRRLGRQAQKLIEISSPGQTLPAMDGIYYRDQPLAGELAFVFTGGMASYSGMGRELLLALPELAVELGRRSRVLGAMADWIYDAGKNVRQLGPQELLLGGTFLSLVYAELTRKLLGVVPDAALGYSSGEVDALLALGVWRDLDELYQDSVESGLFTYSLGGRMDAVRRLWKGLPSAGSSAAGPASRTVGDPEWAEWVLHAPPAKIEAALAGESQVFLTRVHSRDEAAIGGDPAACRRVIERVGARGYLLGAPLAVHCPAVRQVEEAWRALHRRQVHGAGAVRFYTHAGGGYAYEPTSDAVAEALFAQAAGPVDVARLVGRAWDDGVRLFVEHAPQGLATGWIKKALGVLGIPSDACLAVALDSETGGLRHTAHSLARLLAAGVDLDYGAFNERPPGHLAAGAPNQGRATSREILAFPAHWPPVPKPERAEPVVPLPAAPPSAAPPLPEPPASAPGPEPFPAESLPPAPELGTAIAQVQALFTNAQREFVASQNEVHRRFLEVAGRNFAGVLETLPAAEEEDAG